MVHVHCTVRIMRYTLVSTSGTHAAVRYAQYTTKRSTIKRRTYEFQVAHLGCLPESRSYATIQCTLGATTGTYINLYKFVVLRKNVQNPNAAHDRVGYAYAVVRCGISTTVYGVFISMIGSLLVPGTRQYREGQKYRSGLDRSLNRIS